MQAWFNVIGVSTCCVEDKLYGPKCRTVESGMNFKEALTHLGPEKSQSPKPDSPTGNHAQESEHLEHN